MIITINIQDQNDYQWLSPFLETLKSRSNAQIEIKEETSDKLWQEKLNHFFHFIDNNAIVVDKIEIPNRNERNER